MHHSEYAWLTDDCASCSKIFVLYVFLCFTRRYTFDLPTMTLFITGHNLLTTEVIRIISSSSSLELQPSSGAQSSPSSYSSPQTFSSFSAINDQLVRTN